MELRLEPGCTVSQEGDVVRVCGPGFRGIEVFKVGPDGLLTPYVPEPEPFDGGQP